MTDGQNNSKPKKRYISSVEGLDKVLRALGEPEQGTSRFFRGHGNLNYQLQPSIYRNQHLVANEDKIIRDAFTYCPESFSEKETLFEKLVKLQHYGYATRLLDLTENALVALYFAVSSSQDKTAELLVLDIPETEMKYSDSDTVAILSAISLQPALDLRVHKENCQDRALHSFIDSIYRVTETLIIDKKYQKSETAERVFNLIIENTEDFKSREMYLKAFDKYKSNKQIWNHDDAYRLEFNKVKEIASLVQIIRNDKPSFIPVVEAKDLERILCVRAKLNNPRITRQQGLFLLFGIGKNKLEQAQVNPSWIKSSEQRILIKPEYKEKILKELRTFGITKQYLFPELDSQAQEIMNRYKP